MVDSWHAPDQKGKYKKLLISRITNNRESQKIFEDVISTEFKRKGVEALPAYMFLRNGETLARRDVLENAVRQSGVDGVLSIQTTTVEKRANVQPGYMSNSPGFWRPSAFPYWDMYGYYGWSSTFYEPPIVTTYNVATIQANLFDTAQGKLVWAATFESTEPANTVSVSKDMANKIIRSLSKNKMI